MRNPFELDENCSRCPALVRSRTQVVHGYGDPDAEIFFVGRSPHRGGSDETGVPFTGDEAGLRFLGMLERVGLCDVGDRDSVTPRLRCYVANAVRCATPKNRPPRKGELRSCASWLGEEILRVDPTVIVPVGAAAGSTIYDLILGEPFPGARAAHGTSATRWGYGIHPQAHLLRLRTDELRHFVSRLIRIAVHARPCCRGTATALDSDVVGRTLFRVHLATRIAIERARLQTGTEKGERFWVDRMQTFTRIALSALRHVGLADGARPRFRYLGERDGDVYLQPLDDGPEGPRDLHAALQVSATPRGVLEYWLLHRHLWNIAETRRYHLLYREGQLRDLLEAHGESPARRVVDRRRVFPPRVSIEGDHADLTILARDRTARGFALRLATVRIHLSTGTLRYVDREEIRL